MKQLLLIVLSIISTLIVSCTSGSGHRKPAYNKLVNTDTIRSSTKRVRLRSLWYSATVNKYFPNRYLEPGDVDTVFKTGDTIKLDGTLFVIQ